jgi:outer membrane protein assembly factor BamB
MDNSDPRLYVNPQPPMYRTPGESGLSSPAVVNDVVFCSTSKIAVYAFDAYSGKMLWQDQLGEQTGGMNGGYGYCLGPAVSGEYMVAGALVFGKRGGVLRIYSLPQQDGE